MKILLAVDGSEISTRAAKHVAWLAKQLTSPPAIILFNVDQPLLMSVAVKLGASAVAKYHADNAKEMMQPARRVLARAKLEYSEENHVGEIAETIVKHAKKHRVDLVVMGSHGSGAVKGLFLGSVSSKVVSQSDIPVTIIR